MIFLTFHVIYSIHANLPIPAIAHNHIWGVTTNIHGITSHKISAGSNPTCLYRHPVQSPCLATGLLSAKTRASYLFKNLSNKAGDMEKIVKSRVRELEDSKH